MLFNSLTFFVFFACVLTLHYAPLSWKAKKINLLLASYVFYAAWNPPFVTLVMLSTVVDWLLAKRIASAKTLRVKRLCLISSLVVNLGLLGYFKYAGFLLQNFVDFLALFSVTYQPGLPDIILPLGISFYTFQTLSYTIDVYRGQLRPGDSFVDYAMYVCFFPQLVAGPIVRAGEFLPQCREERRATKEQMSWGLSLLVLGLFQKIVVADGLFAPLVQAVYNPSYAPDTAFAWMGTLAFAGQIFCDFAGYSTAAIGVALTLGFNLPRNFRFPYAAIGLSDFWRRWHISLSSWLRDYLYIPLGGNRKGPRRTAINLMLTMLLGGLWHGAAWTFVVWGGLHGFYLFAERWLKARFGMWAVWRLSIGKIALGGLTLAAVCLAWVFFRAESLSQAVAISLALVGIHDGSPLLTLQSPARLLIPVVAAMIAMATLIGIHWSMRERTLERTATVVPWWARSVALATMMVVIVTMPGESRAFIYFQF